MKKTIVIELELPDKLEVYPEEGQSEDDFKGKAKQKELEAFRKQFALDVQKTVMDAAKQYIEDFEDYFMDTSVDDILIDGWDDLEDYGVKIVIKDAKESK